jgi:hypothetical protein
MSLPADLSYYTAEYVAGRLEQAGRALLALPASRCMPAGMKSAWPEYVQTMWEAFNPDDTDAERRAADREALRPGPPSARAISDMDEAYRWITLVDDVPVRKILLLRSLVDPMTDKPRFSWRRLHRQFGLHIDTLQRKHSRGVEQIANRLNSGRDVLRRP